MSAAKLTQRVSVAKAIIHRMLAPMVFIFNLLLGRHQARLLRDRRKWSRECKGLSKVQAKLLGLPLALSPLRLHPLGLRFARGSGHPAAPFLRGWRRKRRYRSQRILWGTA